VCLSLSAKYRGIALSSMWQTVDLLVLYRFRDQLCLSDLQFGLRIAALVSEI